MTHINQACVDRVLAPGSLSGVMLSTLPRNVNCAGSNLALSIIFTIFISTTTFSLFVLSNEFHLSISIGVFQYSQ